MGYPPNQESALGAPPPAVDPFMPATVPPAESAVLRGPR
jgi:hypothetical protein